MPNLTDRIKDFSINTMHNIAGGVSGTAVPPQTGEYTKNEFKECLEHLVAGTVAKDKRKRALQEKIKIHARKNLEKTGEPFLPGQHKTGFRQVQVVDSHSFVAPSGWVEKADVNDFDKVVYEDSLRLMDVDEKDMPANCDILTLNNVVNNKPPCDGKTWNPEIPLHGTDGCGNNVFVLLEGHSALVHLSAEINASHDEPDDCGKDPQSGIRAAWLSALMQLNTAELRKRLTDLKCDKATIDNVCKPLEEAEKSGTREALVATLAASYAGKDPLAYANGTNLGAELGKLAKTILKPLADKGKFSDKGQTNDTQILFMLKRLGLPGVIQHVEQDGPDQKKPGNFVMGGGKLSRDAVAIAAASSEQQAKEMCQLAKGVPVIVGDGKGGYSIRFAKPVADEPKEPEIDPTTTMGGKPEAAGVKLDAAQTAAAAAAAAESQAAMKNEAAKQANADAAAKTKIAEGKARLAAIFETPGAEEEAVKAAEDERVAKAEAAKAEAEAAVAAEAAAAVAAEAAAAAVKAEAAAEAAKAEAAAAKAKAKAEAEAQQKNGLGQSAASAASAGGLESTGGPGLTGVPTQAPAARNSGFVADPAEHQRVAQQGLSESLKDLVGGYFK